jgi:subtilase family serine protease
VNPASVRVGGTITATWAGIPSPGDQDKLRLFPLGASYHQYVAQWATTGAASGALALALPGAAVAGWYELRLLSPDADQLAVIARSDPFRVGASSPDLVVRVVSNPPATAVLSGTFAVTDTVRNEGTGGAGVSTTRYYLSLDALKNTGDRLLSATRAVGALASGGESTGTVTVSVPSTTTLGRYFLLACADDTRLVGEADEADNCRASATTLMVRAPDLVEAALGNPPARVTPGGTFTITDTVRNQGNASAAASTTRYYLSRDAAKSTSDTRLSATRAVPSLAASAQSAGSRILTVPLTATGAYFLLVCADDLKKSAESNETNNCRASATQLAVGN